MQQKTEKMQKPSALKAVLFDLDNTLVDFMRLKRFAISSAVDAMIDAGLDMKKASAERKLYSLYKKHGIENQKIFQKFLKEAIGHVDYRILAYAVLAYRKVKDSFLVSYPKTKKTLIALKELGLKLAIVTDAPRQQAWQRLVAMQLDDFFDVVVAFEDTKKHKPAIEPFLMAMKKLNIAAESCIMLGDWPERDIKGAKKLGIKTAFASYGYMFSKHSIHSVKADYSIKEISQLVRVCKKLI